MFPAARKIGVHFTPTGTRLAAWREGTWRFHRPHAMTELLRTVRAELSLAENERPRGRCSINLAFDGVAPDVSDWPVPWRGILRVANEDFRGVVGLRVLERLGRLIPLIKTPPADIWRVALGRQRDVYQPTPRPDPEDLGDPDWTRPAEGSTPANLDSPVPDHEFAAATALVMAPWVVLLDQELAAPVRFTRDDLRRSPAPPRFVLPAGPAARPNPPDDPRLCGLHEAWSALFNLAGDCLNLDGYDLDDSVAVRMLIDTASQPMRGFTVEQAGSLFALLSELAGWIEELDGELRADTAGLRVQTVELDRPRPPAFAELKG